MSTNFTSLRKNRAANLEKLKQQVKSEGQKGGQDPRIWKLTVDPKTKIGFAVLRFLPPPVNEELSYVRFHEHGFKVGSNYYIENCPTTLGGKPCPVCKDNSKHWDTGLESEKNIARDRKRHQRFMSNVLIIKDPAHPENEGKVFLYKYGPKIYEKINDLLNPSDPSEPVINPFDFWEGCDFKLKSQALGDFQNYDKSSFSDPSELFEGDDEAKEEVWKQQYSLAEFVAEDKFKSYDVLEARFNDVINGRSSRPQTAEDAIKAARPTASDIDEVSGAVDSDDETSSLKSKMRASKPAPKATPKAEAKTPSKPAPKKAKSVDTDDDATTDDDDDIRALFKNVMDN